MVRKLALAVTGWWMCVGVPAWGLGLGDIRVSSALNQSFDASIDLRDLADLNPDEVIVTLGSNDDFTRARLERGLFLLDFHYQVSVRGGGSGVIRVTSSRPVTEPVVEFLVNVVWPSGRLQRQYAVLLDPPSSGVAARSMPASPRTGNGGEQSETGSARAANRPDATQQVRRTARRDRLQGGSYGPTDRDDTLWRIAARVRPSGDVSLHQTMLALQRLNPEAFIGANINRLKAGYTLRVPDAAQAAEIGGGAAVAEVARQVSSWRGGPPTAPAEGAPVQGTQAPAGPAAAAAGHDELTIVRAKPKPGGGSAPAAAGAKDELEQKLAGSKEEQDRLALENADAAAKLAAAAQQTTQLQQQLASRDQQIAALSREMAQVRATLEKLQTAPAGAAALGQPTASLTDTVAGKSLLAAVVALFAGLLGALYLYNRERTQVRATARDPAELGEHLERTVRMERERSGRTIRPGAVAPVASTIAGVAAASPRAVPAAAPRVAPAPAPVTALDLSSTQESMALDKTVILANPGEAARAAAVEDVVAASDVVSEADIYIAYGRFPQAISFLQSALEKEPDRIDARLKLMEAYVETRDAAAFGLEAQALLDRQPNEVELRRARQLQARLPGVTVIPAESIADTGVDFDKTIIDTAMADRAMPEGTSTADPVDLDLDLDQTDLLTEIESAKPLDVDLSEGARARAAADSLDFNLTLDGLDDEVQRDELGGDLGLAFRDERDAGSDLDRTVTPGSSADDDLGLDLTIDGRTTSIEPARRARPPVASADDDQGLSLTLDGKDDDVAAQPRPTARDSAIIANADTVETSPLDEDLDFLGEAPDEARTKLDLARAYIDMGDGDAARDVLNEVLAEGSESHQQEARELLAKLT